MSQKDDESINKISRMLEIGGTMLAQHCAECGAPLFRYKGNVICPVCDTGQRAPLQGHGLNFDKNKNTPTEIFDNSEDKQQLPSSVNVVFPSADLSAGANKTIPMGSETSGRSRSAIAGSLQELENVLIKKIIILAHSMQQEQDLRKIKEFLVLIAQSLDIIDRLKSGP